jgi:gliding motility-associated-like protein
VETIHGCTDDVSHVVEIEPDFMFYIPNTFTPNNDGRNDYFRPYGEGVKWETFEMTIYTRWGEEIFHTGDIENPWRGWYKDREVEVGVYVYMIRIFDQNGEQHTYRDHVTLMR